jgi:membrane-associated protein
VFGWLTDAISGSAWSYALVLAIVAVDAVFPIVPGETAVITGAVLAANGELSIVLVLAAAMAGAVAGDNAGYWLGRSLGRRAIERFARGERARARVDWSGRQLRVRGAWILVVARFVPGGRTATTLAAGALRMSWVRFARADAAGAVLWSAYVAGLGWFGASTFEHSLWKPLLLALGVGVLLAALGEWLRRRLDRTTAQDG